MKSQRVIHDELEAKLHAALTYGLLDLAKDERDLPSDSEDQAQFTEHDEVHEV